MLPMNKTKIYHPDGWCLVRRYPSARTTFFRALFSYFVPISSML